MKIKSMVLSMMVVTACGFSAMANEASADHAKKGSTKGPAALNAEALKKSLNLTDDQVTKLKPLLAQVVEYRKEAMTKVKGGTPVTQSELQEKIAEILAPAKDFLSPEQFSSLTEKASKPAKRQITKKKK